MSSDRLVILGAGPAGMACSFTLAKNNQPSIVIERDKMPGGLCQTLRFHEYLFDIGGHRFLSKSSQINELWHQVMGDDLLRVKRLSRIYYRGKFFDYPLSLWNTLWSIGPVESVRCVLSYLKHKYFERVDDTSVEGWIINRFGKRLYEIFFKTYTEKVWAVDCRNLSAKWTAQRIRGLSLRVAVQNALLGLGGGRPKTLADEFLYPREGPGEFYKRLEKWTSELGSQFAFRKTVTRVHHDGQRIISIDIQDNASGHREEIPADYLFSSIPLTVLVKIFEPRPPESIIFAAGQLHFRHFLVVNVILNKEHVFPDQWIYIHSPDVKMGRIQNYKNWSKAMVPDLQKTSLGLEYFCWEEDELWRMKDEDVIQFALMELEKIGMASRGDLLDGFVVRRSNVYPVYSTDYQKSVDTVRGYLSQFSNLQTMGRGGLFRYDNSDHALLTGIYAANNFLGSRPHDLWEVNTEEAYLES